MSLGIDLVEEKSKYLNISRSCTCRLLMIDATFMFLPIIWKVYSDG